jgi:hypothetical protein
MGWFYSGHPVVPLLIQAIILPSLAMNHVNEGRCHKFFPEFILSTLPFIDFILLTEDVILFIYLELCMLMESHFKNGTLITV